MANSVPLLRRPHGRHRDLRTRTCSPRTANTPRTENIGMTNSKIKSPVNYGKEVAWPTPGKMTTVRQLMALIRGRKATIHCSWIKPGVRLIILEKSVSCSSGIVKISNRHIPPEQNNAQTPRFPPLRLVRHLPFIPKAATSHRQVSDNPLQKRTSLRTRDHVCFQSCSRQIETERGTLLKKRKKFHLIYNFSDLKQL